MSQVTLTRNGRVQEIRSVDYGPAAPLATIPCPKCPMTFLNQQGLGNHLRSRHPPVVGVSVAEAFKRSWSRGHADLPWEDSGSGRCWVVQVQFEVKDGGGRFPKSVKFKLQPRAAKTVDPSEDPSMYDGFMPETEEKGPGRSGAPSRRSYTHRYKASMATRLREMERYQHFRNDPLAIFGGKVGGCGDNICKWAKEESYHIKQASRRIVADLSRTPRANQWFPSAERILYSLFQARRKNKQKVSTKWVSVTFNKILREDHADGRRSRTFRASYRWARKWAKTHNLSTRRKSNNKNKSVQERLPKIQRWHKGFRLSLIHI